MDSLIDSINTERKHKTHLETGRPRSYRIKNREKRKGKSMERKHEGLINKADNFRLQGCKVSSGKSMWLLTTWREHFGNVWGVFNDHNYWGGLNGTFVIPVYQASSNSWKSHT